MEGAEFGRELRRLRGAAGLSLGALARATHFDKGYLSRVETGERTPSPQLSRLCDQVLGTGGYLTRLLLSGAAPRIPAVREQPAEDPPAAAGRAPTDPLLRAPFAAMLTELRKLGQSSPSGTVLELVRAQLTGLRSLAATPDPELLRLMARYAEYAGWLTQEAGDAEAAQYWTTYAWRYATRAGDAELAAYTKVRQAELAMERGDPVSTLDYATEVQADPAASARTRALAAHREAQAHALLFDARRVAYALHRARRWGFAHAEEHGVLGSSTIVDMAAMADGWCAFELGDHDTAIERLEHGLAQIPESSRRIRAIFGSRLALAYLAADQVDNACTAGHRAWELAQLTDSATAGAQLKMLARNLQRRRSNSAAMELFNRLTTAGPLPSGAAA
ncbi:helix-turn-helix domain-containing protein [Hamadaea tsunoensis]|uniref:helix-turn-helix domain-containing protein n=1 Tax=Hamadaea tsunoensis TaxID=53368 RepID=UPI00041DFC16|nr:helix-turn-helix transcriptional regulator [Hamadaea tsunoensis]